VFNYESRRDGLPVRFVPSFQRYRGPLLLCYVRRPLWRTCRFEFPGKCSYRRVINMLIHFRAPFDKFPLIDIPRNAVRECVYLSPRIRDAPLGRGEFKKRFIYIVYARDSGDRNY